MSRIVTLTTDFGTADGYVGEMKGCCCRWRPPRRSSTSRTTFRRRTSTPRGSRSRASGVGSQRGRFISSSSILASDRRGRRSPWRRRSLPRGAGQRRAVAGVAGLWRAWPSPFAFPTARQRRSTAATCSLRRPPRSHEANPSTTLGSPPDRAPIVRRTPEPVRGPGGTIEGEVIAIDRFGNAITNLTADGVAAVVVGHRTIPIRRAYADVEIGEALAVVGSGGSIEIAVRNDSAARALHLSRGDKVTLRVES